MELLSTRNHRDTIKKILICFFTFICYLGASNTAKAQLQAELPQLGFGVNSSFEYNNDIDPNT